MSADWNACYAAASGLPLAIWLIRICYAAASGSPIAVWLIRMFIYG